MTFRTRVLRTRSELLHRLPPEVDQLARRTLARPRPWDPWATLSAPALQAGHRPAPPDHVGIGAQKAGTSWLSWLLDRHPDVHPVNGGEKELHYFDRFLSADFDDAAAEEYRLWHARPPGQRCGEWTPNYLSSVWVPPLLVRAAPEVRVVALLRDPLARFASGISHSLSRRERLTERLVGEAVDRGRYGTHLARWLQFVPRDRFFVGVYEQFAEDPDREVRRLLEFLELDYPPSYDELVRTRVHDSSDKRHAVRVGVDDLPEHLRRSLAETYVQEREILESLDLGVDTSRWRTSAT